MITGYDHVQVAIPAGGEDTARSFYAALLEMTETAKPPALAAREIPGVRRLHTHDPFGNRVEFQQV